MAIRSLPQRPLGETGVTVPLIGYGTAPLGREKISRDLAVRCLNQYFFARTWKNVPATLKAFMKATCASTRALGFGSKVQETYPGTVRISGP